MHKLDSKFSSLSCFFVELSTFPILFNSYFHYFIYTKQTRQISDSKTRQLKKGVGEEKKKGLLEHKDSRTPKNSTPREPDLKISKFISLKTHIWSWGEIRLPMFATASASEPIIKCSSSVSLLGSSLIYPTKYCMSVL